MRDGGPHRAGHGDATSPGQSVGVDLHAVLLRRRLLVQDGRTMTIERCASGSLRGATILAVLSCACLAAGCGQSGSTSDAGAGDATTAGEAGGRATVAGTLTLPGAAAGKPYGVRIYSMAGTPGAVPVAETMGVTTAATKIDYSIAEVPAGTYFILGFVAVSGVVGQSSMAGDYAGWYGHKGDGNPPAAPNALVPASGMVRFDFSLVLR